MGKWTLKNHKYTSEKYDCIYDNKVDIDNKGGMKMYNGRPKSDLAKVGGR